MEMPDLPAAPGTYLLWLALDRDHTLQIGRLGKFDFAAGLYAYVGSAQGPGGLRARVGRHLKQDKPCHWHVDFITAVTPVAAVWFDAGLVRLECPWAAVLAALPGVAIPVDRFGASDCCCPAHLVNVPVTCVPTARQALEPVQTRVTAAGFTFLG